MVVLICISVVISDIEHFFSCACWPSVYLPWRNVYSGLLPIFPLIDWVFGVGLYELFIYSRD